MRSDDLELVDEAVRSSKGTAARDGTEPVKDIPLVSVVIPVGRVDEELRIQLDALAAQEFEEAWEIVLAVNTIDSEERRRLVALAALHPLARIVEASAVRSASYARNRGAEEAGAAVLAFCDGDDVAQPGWLSAIVGGVQPGVAIGGHLDETQLEVAGQENWRPPATPEALPTFLGTPYLVSANMALWRDDFVAAGMFDNELTRCEDIALSFQLLRLGVELRYSPAAVISYRHRNGLGAMMRQHYLYGIGMAQVLARDGLPGESNRRSLVRSLTPNSQSVGRLSTPNLLRRCALAAGRLVGTLRERGRR